MIKIEIITTGRTKEPWLELALAEYQRRLRGHASLVFILVKDEAQLITAALGAKHAIGLDPQGEELTSNEFSRRIEEMVAGRGPRLAFVIGGPEGLPHLLRERLPLLSLSKLTFTHQMARLLLVEQLYRGFEIAKGSPYHR